MPRYTVDVKAFVSVVVVASDEDEARELADGYVEQLFGLEEGEIDDDLLEPGEAKVVDAEFPSVDGESDVEEIDK